MLFLGLILLSLHLTNLKNRTHCFGDAFQSESDDKKNRKIFLTRKNTKNRIVVSILAQTTGLVENELTNVRIINIWNRTENPKQSWLSSVVFNLKKSFKVKKQKNRKIKDKLPYFTN